MCCHIWLILLNLSFQYSLFAFLYKNMTILCSWGPHYKHISFLDQIYCNYFNEGG